MDTPRSPVASGLRLAPSPRSSGRSTPRWLACAAAGALSLQANVSRAQAPAAPSPSGSSTDGSPSVGSTDGSNDGSAEGSVRLFREGRQLLNEGRVAEACEKFNASLQLRRSPGTLLNVGHCLQSSNDLLGALQIFEEALDKARREPDPQKAEAWSTAARTEMANVEPRLPRVVVTRPSDASVRVELDGRVLSRWGEPTPVNPGSHRLVASAVGKASFERTIESVEGQTETIELPELTPLPAQLPPELAPAAPPPTAPPLAPVPPSSVTPAASAGETQGASPGVPVAPLWIAGIGSAVLLGGLITGGVAAKQASDLKRECPNKICEGNLSARDSVHRTAVVADGLMATGLVGVAVGTIWLLVAGDADAPALDAACDLHGCGAAVRGRF